MTEIDLNRKIAISLQRLKQRLRSCLAENAAADPQAWQQFDQRLDVHFPRLFRLYHDLYRDNYDFFYHLEDLLCTLGRLWFARPPDLRVLDGEREKDPLWFQSQSMLGGVCYVDLFAGDLNGVRSKIPYFKELGLTYLHLMPLFEVPEGENDGGYAVSSYREVRPQLGTMMQLSELARELRRQGISLVLDLVFNHTSDEHEWALRALAGEVEYQEYYRMFPDRRMPDAYEAHLREIFPGRAPRRLHLSPGDRPLGVDDLPCLPVGFELRQSGGVQPHGGRDAIPGQRRGGSAAPGRGCLHLETAGHQLREPARSAHPDPGLQRCGPHRGTGADYSNLKRSSTRMRWCAIFRLKNASSPITLY